MPAVVMRDYRGQHDVTLGGKVVSGGTCEIHLEDAFLLVKGERVHRIAYEEIDIEKRPEAAEIVMRLNDGMRKVPTLDVEGIIVSGDAFDAARFEKDLRAAGAL